MEPGDLVLVWHKQGPGLDLQHPQQTSKPANLHAIKTETRPQAEHETAKALAQPMTHITLSAHCPLFFLSSLGTEETKGKAQEPLFMGPLFKDIAYAHSRQAHKGPEQLSNRCVRRWVLCIFKGPCHQHKHWDHLSYSSHIYPQPAMQEPAVPVSLLTRQLYLLPVPWQAGGLEAWCVTAF